MSDNLPQPERMGDDKAGSAMRAGATWASVPCVYLPENIDESIFFLHPASPDDLYLNAAPAGATEISRMH
ncbi:MAG: hypothetical protein AAF458_13860 [Pseudomonadota bacterium]